MQALLKCRQVQAVKVIGWRLYRQTQLPTRRSCYPGDVKSDVLPAPFVTPKD